MNLRKPIFKLILPIIILFGVNQKVLPDPWVWLSFLNDYASASPLYSMCETGTKALYAVKPGVGFCSVTGTFQWYTFEWGLICVPGGGGMMICHNGWKPVTISGATTNSYTVAYNSASNGQYWCTVDCGSGEYNTDTIMFEYALSQPQVVTQPENKTICEGSSASFTFSASGEYLNYQWYKKSDGSETWSTISGEKSKTYSFTPSAGDDLSQYKCYISNGCGNLYTNPATLDIRFKPSITQNPATKTTLCKGGQSTFSLQATGDGLSYQWQISTNDGGFWGDLTTSGKYSINNNQMTITDIEANMSGYLYRCIVSGNCDPSATSSNAALIVNSPPTITSSPVSSEKCIGDTVAFSVLTAGTAPFEYYWRKNETGLAGWSSSPQYTIKGLDLSYIGSYDVLVRNICDAVGVESDNASLVVNSLPSINLGDDLHICNGSAVELDAGAGLSGYDWNTGENTQKISVAASDTFMVTVTDDNNCKDSDTIIIAVDPNIPPVSLGNDTAVCLGSYVEINAGTGYDNYNWSNGSTSESITVFQTNDYTVEVSINGNICKEKDTLHVLVAEPFPDEEICLVTIDLETGKNMVVWEKTADAGIASYNIYRESNVSGVYDSIGNVPHDNLSLFVDMKAIPEQQQYLYKISAIDTCGNESDLSQYHKTLFLQYTGSDVGVNLGWKLYQIEETPISFSSYILYKGSDSTALQPFDTISGGLDAYTDLDPNVLEIRYYYRIAGVRAQACAPTGILKAGTGPYSHSMSNIEDNRLQAPAENQAATNISLDATSIDENEPAGSPVGQFTTTDPNSGDTHTYSLVAGTGSENNSSFTITGNSLLVAVIFDYETKNTYSIRVKTTDSGEGNLSFEKQITISVNNLIENQAATNISLDATSIDENEPAGSPVGQFTTTDPNSGDTHTYSLVAGTGSENNSSFTITGNSLLVAVIFDYETKNTYSIRVKTTDSGEGNLSFEKQITITVNNLIENQAATNISLDATSIDENKPAGSPVGQFTTTDPNSGDTHTYSLVAGTGSENNSSFTISGDSLLTDAIFDFETKNTYSIRVKTTDSGEGHLAFEKTFSITVNNVIEAGLGEISDQTIRIYPNPFNETVTIEFPNPGHNKYSLKIMDLSGKVVRTVDNIRDSQFIFQRRDLENGLYLLELKGDKIYRGKIVVE